MTPEQRVCLQSLFKKSSSPLINTLISFEDIIKDSLCAGQFIVAVIHVLKVSCLIVLLNPYFAAIFYLDFSMKCYNSCCERISRTKVQRDALGAAVSNLSGAASSKQQALDTIAVTLLHLSIACVDYYNYCSCVFRLI